MNEPVAYDIGYRYENGQSCLFALDDQCVEVHKIVGFTGPYICADQELEIRDWCAARGATTNILPSYKHFGDERTNSIMRMMV